MKLHPQHSRNHGWLAAVAMTFAIGLAIGQPAAPTPPKAPVPSPSASAEPQSLVIPVLRFQSATLGDVTDYLVKETEMNIVVSADARKLPVQDLELRNVTGPKVMEALQYMGLPIQVVLSSGDPSQDGRPITVISRVGGPQEQAPPVTRVFNLRSIVDARAGAPPPETTEAFEALVNQLTEAVKVALLAPAEVTGREPSRMAVKVHVPTRIMVISGDAGDVEIAGQVILSLGGKSVTPGSGDGSARDPFAEIQRAFERREMLRREDGAPGAPGDGGTGGRPPGRVRER